jgi:hypothetical protein
MSGLSAEVNSGFGSIWFRYEIHNITMRYIMESANWTHFFVSLCAILGGSFALLGLINQTLNNVKASKA